MNKVFVYGTLKRGRGNHPLLEGSKFLGEDTLYGFLMYNTGRGYPGIKPSLEHQIHGEVFEVDDHTMHLLDSLEGYPFLYDRREVNTEFGKSWVYIINDLPPNAKSIVEGMW